MTNDDRAEFATQLAVLAQLHNEPVSELRAEAYWLALSELPLEQFKTACLQAAKRLKFFPKPAELIELATGASEDGAEAAWQEYKQLARAVGGYASPELDAALAETITLVFGGWQQACWTDYSPEMWASKRKEFARTYRLLKQRVDGGRRRLVGLHDEHNDAHGLLDETPKKLLPQ